MAFRAACCRFVQPFRKEIAMQSGNLETRSTEHVVTPTSESENPMAGGLLLSASKDESASGATKEERTVTTESTLQPSGRSWLQSRIGSLWRRLRDQRREAAAAIVLIVMAMIWSDTGSSGTGSTSNALDAFESYEAVLSDFEPVSEVQPVRESADPLDSFSQNSSESGLYFPPSEGSAPSDTFSVKNASPDSDSSASATTARFPDTASAFNASPTRKSPDSGTVQQQPRKVKFAGRIQPAN